MSGYKRHQMFGLLLVYLVIILQSYYNDFGLKLFALALPITLFYSILPDIDTSASKARKIVFTLLLLALLYSMNNGGGVWSNIIVFLMLIVIWLLSHRGFTHSLACSILLSLPVGYFMGIVYGLVAWIAYTSHLILDKKMRLI